MPTLIAGLQASPFLWEADGSFAGKQRTGGSWIWHIESWHQNLKRFHFNFVTGKDESGHKQ